MSGLREGQRVRVKHGPFKGKLGVIFAVQDGIPFVLLDGDEYDMSFRWSWLESAA